MARRRTENDLMSVRQGTFVEEMVGWQDYNDLATKTTPITLTDADTWYNLTNDALGPYTQNKYKVLGKPDTYNPSTNSFNFSGLFLGGIQVLRTSFFLTPSSTNTEVCVRLNMAIGSETPYNIVIEDRYLKRRDRKYHFSVTTFFTLDNQNTIDFPAQLQVMSDGSGDEVEVDGWKILTLDRF